MIELTNSMARIQSRELKIEASFISLRVNLKQKNKIEKHKEGTIIHTDDSSVKMEVEVDEVKTEVFAIQE